MWESISSSRTLGFGAALLITLFTARLIMRSRKNRRKITRIIDTVEELQRPCVRMKDPDLVEEKVCQLIEGGPKKLHVISDFDMTLTRLYLNGKRCSSCHGAIETSNKMPTAYREKVLKYKEHYYPIEIDPSLTAEQKTPFMVEWWTKAHACLLETKLYSADLKQMVKESNIHLRTGCQSFLDVLFENQVPLTIFSAGIGNILEEVLRQQASFYDNINVISNYMNFDEQGKLSGFSDVTIHAYNKNSCNLISGDDECFKGRSNVILLGDSLGDINMHAGLKNVDTILRIGFLNNNIEASQQKYVDNYDIVLINDQTMDVVNGIIRKLF